MCQGKSFCRLEIIEQFHIVKEINHIEKGGERAKVQYRGERLKEERENGLND